MALPFTNPGRCCPGQSWGSTAISPKELVGRIDLETGTVSCHVGYPQDRTQHQRRLIWFTISEALVPWLFGSVAFGPVGKQCLMVETHGGTCWGSIWWWERTAAHAEVDDDRKGEMKGEKGIRIQRCVSEGQIVTLPVRCSPVAFHCSEVRSFLTSPMHTVAWLPPQRPEPG